VKLSAQLDNIKRLFLDSAPVIYYIEGDQRYLAHVDIVFNALDEDSISAVTSPITLSECLIVPLRNAQETAYNEFVDLIMNVPNVYFQVINETVALKAADLRARYNITLTDALQLATAVITECDGFLTNDVVLKRVKEINVIVLSEFEAA
jgi:predicted nucleic acid-binding protein